MGNGQILFLNIDRNATLMPIQGDEKMSEITFLRTYTDPDDTELINCNSDTPTRGVTFEIRPARGLKLGDAIQTTWVGSFRGEELPDTKKIIGRFVNEEDVNKGYLEETVGDYQTCIKPIRNGTADVRVVINRDEGNPVLGSIRVILINGLGDYCPGH
jgi:hypothetical protein